MKTLIRFLKNDEATASVEYAVMIAAILLAAIVSIAAVGTQTDVLYGEVDAEMQAHGIK